MKFHKPP